MRELAGVERRPPERPASSHVVIDVRPLQEPDRLPITAGYLRRLLAAFAAEPLPGESFVPILRTMRPDPTEDLEDAGLPIATRRRVLPTARFLRSAGLTIDAFQLRGAEVGAGTAAGSAPAVYHTAGGAVPLGSDLPVVATVLDLAPWELPSIYATSPAARFGHRLRARILRDATRLIVCSSATGASASRLLHVLPDRIAVVPLAPDEEFTPDPAHPERLADLRGRLHLPERYFAFVGRYDARKDLGTLFRALASLAAGGAASPSVPWPPVVVLAGAEGADETDGPALARAAARHGVTRQVRLVPLLGSWDLATLEAGAEAVVFPAISEGTGLRVQEALALGIPAVASRVGPLPELVGPAGIIVEPRDPGRLAAALRASWSGHIHDQLRRVARQRAKSGRRTWADVARETREVYAAAAREGRPSRSSAGSEGAGTS